MKYTKRTFLRTTAAHFFSRKIKKSKYHTDDLPGGAVLARELLDPVASEPGPGPLLEHVVGRVEPAVTHHLLQRGTLPGCPLEDPHEQPGRLHRHLLVQPLELELDRQDVLLGLLGRLTLQTVKEW